MKKQGKFEISFLVVFSAILLGVIILLIIAIDAVSAQTVMICGFTECRIVDDYVAPIGECNIINHRMICGFPVTPPPVEEKRVSIPLETQTEVPEFGTISIITLVIGILGFLIQRRTKND